MAVENDKIVYGGDLMLFVGTGATKNPLAFSTNATLEISLDTREISSKDSGDWKGYKAGPKGWTCSTDGLASFSLTGTTSAVEDLYDMFIAGDAVNVAFGIKTGTSPDWTLDATEKYFSGVAIITSLNLSSANNDNATYSISLQGDGELTLT